MGDNLFKFLKNNPLWAILVIFFAVLPIIGLILPLFRRAFGSRGHEKNPSPLEFNSGQDTPLIDEKIESKSENGQAPSKEV